MSFKQFLEQRKFAEALHTQTAMSEVVGILNEIAAGLQAQLGNETTIV